MSDKEAATFQEAARGAALLRAHWGTDDFKLDSAPVQSVVEYIQTLDDYDRVQGIHRIRLDDAAVERVAVALMNSQRSRHGLRPLGADGLSERAMIDARAVTETLKAQP